MGTDRQIGVFSHQQTIVISVDGKGPLFVGGPYTANIAEGVHKFGISYVSLASYPGAQGEFEFSVRAGHRYRFELVPIGANSYDLKQVEVTDKGDLVEQVILVRIEPGEKGTAQTVTTIQFVRVRR
jgi:hypothetical protein